MLMPVDSRGASAPIPIPSTHPTELHTLILAKRWPAVIERCQSNPNEVGSSSHLRNERGYTALHSLAAYSHSTPGEELAPVVRAVLRAADVIEYAADYRLGGRDGNERISVLDDNKVNTNEVVEEGDNEGETRSSGSWRLLLDQNNRASWSPLHLVCVQGGICSGKVPILNALLQMELGECNHLNRFQHQLLTTLDRQNRNIMHHMLDSVVPSDDTFGAVRFVLGLTPSLLFQRDTRSKTPLEYVLDRLMENDGSRRRHYMNSYGNDGDGIRKNYMMLRLLVELMERESSDREVQVEGTGELFSAGRDSVTVNVPGGISRNILQLACLLPSGSCPPNGALIQYLASNNTFKLERQARDVDQASSSVNMAEEKDENGDSALHLFVSNKTYTNASSSKLACKSLNAGVECRVISSLLHSYRGAVATPNKANDLPLRIAMKAGRRQAVAVLVLEHPDAAMLDESMQSTKLFMHLLGCISVPSKVCSTGSDESNTSEQQSEAEIQMKCLTTMFGLLRHRPDVLSMAGTCSRHRQESTEGTRAQKWWKNIVNRFR